MKAAEGEREGEGGVLTPKENLPETGNWKTCTAGCGCHSPGLCLQLWKFQWSLEGGVALSDTK